MMIGAAAAAAGMGVQSTSAGVVRVETTIVSYVEPVMPEIRTGIPVDPERLRSAVEHSDIPDSYFDEDLDDV